MAVFFAKRVLAAFALLIVITAITYALIYSGGGSIARNVLGEFATKDQIDSLTTALGLDRPLWVQYGDWLAHAVRGDLGASFFTSTPVTESLRTRIPVTLSIITTAIVVSTSISVVLGITAGVRRGWLDRALQLFAVTAESLPNFWLALVLVSAFAISVQLFPATGYIPFTESIGGWLSTIALPVTALVIGGIASGAQQIRSAVIDVLQQDYVRTLRSRGLPERTILARNVLRNAAPPAVTVISLQFIGLLGGTILIERVFALPGLGSLAVDAAIRGDIPVVMGVLVTTAIVVVVVNLLVDLAITWINPKARAQ